MAPIDKIDLSSCSNALVITRSLAFIGAHSLKLKNMDSNSSEFPITAQLHICYGAMTA